LINRRKQDYAIVDKEKELVHSFKKVEYKIQHLLHLLSWTKKRSST